LLVVGVVESPLHFGCIPCATMYRYHSTLQENWTAHKFISILSPELIIEGRIWSHLAPFPAPSSSRYSFYLLDSLTAKPQPDDPWRSDLVNRSPRTPRFCASFGLVSPKCQPNDPRGCDSSDKSRLLYYLQLCSPHAFSGTSSRQAKASSILGGTLELLAVLLFPYMDWI
jgi:hypothetical protein